MSCHHLSPMLVKTAFILKSLEVGWKKTFEKNCKAMHKDTNRPMDIPNEKEGCLSCSSHGFNLLTNKAILK